MSNQTVNPVAKFLRQKGFQVKSINSECTQVSLSSRKLYSSEVTLALGDNFSGYFIEQSGLEVYVLYSEDASLLSEAQG
mgnify:CR=1 FL=1